MSELSVGPLANFINQPHRRLAVERLSIEEILVAEGYGEDRPPPVLRPGRLMSWIRVWRICRIAITAFSHFSTAC